MRKINTNDCFLALDLINNLGLSEEVRDGFQRAKNGKNIDATEFGVELIFKVLGRATNERAKKTFYEFVGGVLEIKPEDVGLLDPYELVENLKLCFEMNGKDRWSGFFKSLVRLATVQD